MVPATSGGMDVRVHPHTGLQTVSWLFAGTIEHRDSGGNHALVRPGELNLMTAGAGISHSERSTPDTDILHGVQLWTALPSTARFVERRFEHYVPPVVTGAGWSARVFMGSLFGSQSPVETYTPLLGAELSLEPGASVEASVDASYELGVLVDTGAVSVEGTAAGRGTLLYLSPGRASLRVTAGADGARILLLGGPPFGEPIVMWWNFVARSHEEIVAYRAQWEAEISGKAGATQFDQPVGDPEAPLPAPPLPDVRILPRE
jgi:redox-sensitive bicupin YhaK (pirin superfamily)